MPSMSLRIPDNLMAELNREAKSRRVPKSRLVREGLEVVLRRKPAGGKASCYDLASDLAGTIKGLPKDLARNPKYMKGFGE